MEALGEACFRKTWYIRQGKNAGMATNKPRFHKIRSCDSGKESYRPRSGKI